MTRTKGKEAKVMSKAQDVSESVGSLVNSKAKMKLKAVKTKFIKKVMENRGKDYRPTTKKDTISNKEIKFQILIPILKTKSTEKDRKKTRTVSKHRKDQSLGTKTNLSKQKIKRLQQKIKGKGIAEKREDKQSRSKYVKNSLHKRKQNSLLINKKTSKISQNKANQTNQLKTGRKQLRETRNSSLEQIKTKTKAKSNKKNMKMKNTKQSVKKGSAKSKIDKKNCTKSVIEVDSNSTFFMYNNSLLKPESSQKEDEAKTAKENLSKRIYLLDFQRQDDCWAFKLMDKKKKICTCKIIPNLDSTCQLSCACSEFKQGGGKACSHLNFVVKQIAHCGPVLEEFQRDGSVCDVGFWQLNMSMKIALHCRYILEKNPSIETANNKLCYICMQKIYENTQEVKECPKCQRSFHSECMAIFRAYKPTCPLCRFTLPADESECEEIVIDMTNIEF